MFNPRFIRLDRKIKIGDTVRSVNAADFIRLVTGFETHKGKLVPMLGKSPKEYGNNWIKKSEKPYPGFSGYVPVIAWPELTEAQKELYRAKVQAQRKNSRVYGRACDIAMKRAEKQTGIENPRITDLRDELHYSEYRRRINILQAVVNKSLPGILVELGHDKIMAECRQVLNEWYTLCKTL